MGRYLYDQEREAIEAKAAEEAELAIQRERVKAEKAIAKAEAKRLADRERLSEAAKLAKREATVTKAALRETTEKLVGIQARVEAMVGCPAELSASLIDELCSDIKRYPIKVACENNGLSTAKLLAWRALAGRPGAHPLLIELDRRVAKAKASGDIQVYDAVVAAAEKVVGEETRFDKNGNEVVREILLSKADAKVLLELARARMPELSPRTIVPVEEKPLEDAVDFRSLMSDADYEKYLEGREAEERAKAKAASNEMLQRMNERARLPAVDTEGTPVLGSGDEQV